MMVSECLFQSMASNGPMASSQPKGRGLKMLFNTMRVGLHICRMSMTEINTTSACAM